MFMVWYCVVMLMLVNDCDVVCVCVMLCLSGCDVVWWSVCGDIVCVVWCGVVVVVCVM